MSKLLLKLPWFLSAPLVVLIAGGFAYVAFALTGEYFNETCTNERNLLTGEIEASNCGEGAEVAKRLREEPADAKDSPAGAVVATGAFRDGTPGHKGSGTAEVQRLPDGRLNVFLKDFSVTNGPDLFVVLTKDAGGDYRDGDLILGELKANNGSQNYDVPNGTDIAAYRTVLIWCKQFDVQFAYAPIEAVAADAPAVETATTASAQKTPEPASAASTATPAGTTEKSPEPTSAAPTPTPTAKPAQGPGVVASGTFRDGAPGHNGSGRAEVQRLADGSLNVFLSGFSVTNGPDLFVVLSTSDNGDYSDGDVLLASLKANNGNQNYAIPAGTDVSRFKSVMIWCRAFDTVFAYAPIEVQP